MCAQDEMSVFFSFFLFISTAQEELQTCQVCRLRAKLLVNSPSAKGVCCFQQQTGELFLFCFWRGGIFPVSEVDKVS